MNNILVKLPIITSAQLDCISTGDYGITIYRGILVAWDEDYDPRVLTLIDERFSAIGSSRPLAISEHEGGVSILWDEDPMVLSADADGGYTVENDWWNADHYVRSDGGAIPLLPQRDEIFNP